MRFPCLSYGAMTADQILAARELADIRPAPQSNPPRRILVVEDDGDIRRLNTEVLIRYGYHVDAAEDGAVAWQSLNTGSYDLLITDNNMPNVTGVELLKKLHGARMALPVIMATGSVPRWEFTEYPWLLPAATLLKPYTLSELMGTVRKVLCATVAAREQPAPPSSVIPPDWNRTAENHVFSQRV